MPTSVPAASSPAQVVLPPVPSYVDKLDNAADVLTQLLAWYQEKLAVMQAVKPKTGPATASLSQAIDNITTQKRAIEELLPKVKTLVEQEALQFWGTGQAKNLPAVQRNGS